MAGVNPYIQKVQAAMSVKDAGKAPGSGTRGDSE